MDPITIGDRTLEDEESTFIIAEAGSNHNGDLDMAKELIDVAVDAGADAVKFQTFRAEDLYVEDSGEAEYLQDDRSIYEIIEDMEMPYEWISELHDYCEKQGILFMSTPFDERSADELAEYVPAFKVASYTMNHHPFLRYLAEKDKPIIMSTGAHELEEVQESVEVLKEAGVSDLVLLQCSAAYPTPLDSINVRAVETLREEFNVYTGLSDHTLDPTAAPAAAVSLGATVVEKHFTLDKTLDGPDHEFALEPDELDEMVTAIRKTEEVLGSGKKEVLETESELHDIARRSVQATADISKGETLTDDNIAVLRPGKNKSGLEPKHYEALLGRIAEQPISQGEGVTWDDVAEE